MKSYAFLFWAYNVFWAAIALYIAYLVVRLRRFHRRLDRIERALERERAAREP